MAKDNGGPAFPGTDANGLNNGVPGMALRDYFAAAALTGLIAESIAEGSESTVVAITRGKKTPALPGARISAAAYVLADAMLRAREQP